MTDPNKRKGDRAELEAARVLSDLFGYEVRRALGAGRALDTGDMFGIPDLAVQVAWWPRDTIGAVRHKPVEAMLQAANAHVPHSTAMIRLVKGQWRMVQTPEAFARLYRQAMA